MQIHPLEKRKVLTPEEVREVDMNTDLVITQDAVDRIKEYHGLVRKPMPAEEAEARMNKMRYTPLP